ncbi:MAG: hypothetical protein J7L15_07725, partial [Clostridiales bacterium]|nr:hypothetical protein [Clostridiales bacterium]
MYFYSIGHYDYECSSEIKLMHEDQINKENFEDMYVKAVVDVLINRKGYLSNHIGLEEGKLFPSDWEMGKDNIY